jgi:hypothetical protein
MNTAVRRSSRLNAFCKRPHVVLALMAVLVANATPTLAQDAGDPSVPGRRFSNEAIAAHAKWLAQTSPAQPNTTTPERSWVYRHPIPTATLIGAGVGVGLAGRSGSVNHGIGLLVGAGAGALSGAILSAARRPHYDASDSRPDPVAVQRVVAALGAGERIIVTDLGSRETTGRIEAFGQDDFTLITSDQGSPVQIAYAGVRAVKGARKIGTTIGIVAGVIGAVGLSIMCAEYCGGN